MNAQNWYVGNGQDRNQAPLIMVPTPRGIMEKEIKSILNNATSTSDMKIKFCQMGSRKLASIAKSD